MAHLTNIPYITNGNVMELLNRFAIRFVQKYGYTYTVNILIVGGSAIALRYNSRATVDIDADIAFGGKISDIINQVALDLNIPNDWLNQDFVNSYSYSRKLWDRAEYIGTLNQVINVYIVSELDQLCMKSITTRTKDEDDVIVLAKALKNKGVTYEMFTENFYRLYRDYVKISRSKDKIIKSILKGRRNNRLSR